MVEYENHQLKLQWVGPLSIKDREFYNQTLPGLYMFTVPFRGEYFVQYIGKTQMPLPARLIGSGSTTGHLRDTVSGRYFLYDPAERRNLRLVTAYKLGEDFSEFFMNLEKYQTIARENLEDTAFFFCPFQEQVELIEIAESILIFHVLTSPNQATDFPIIENSKRIAAGAYNCELSVLNIFPTGNIIRGFDRPMHSPKRE